MLRHLHNGSHRSGTEPQHHRLLRSPGGQETASLAGHRVLPGKRKEGLKGEGIASRLSALKVFSNKYICEHLELTNTDLLRKVPRITPPEKPIPALTEDEREAILDSFRGGSLESIRNLALLAVYMATGLRFREVIDLDLEKLDRVSGEMTVKVKGGRQRIVRLSPLALIYLKEYLKIRPSKADTGRLWLTAEGIPLSYWGGQSVFRRLKEKTGLKKLHAHVLRHTFAQVALEKGAERAMVQDMMGHKSDATSRRYASNVRAETATRMMPEYSPV